MKRLALAIAATTALVLGASGAHAQEVEPEIEVETEHEPGATATVNVTGAEPNATINVALGDEAESGAADADGIGSVDIAVPDAEGPHDGIVTINGVDFPISIVVAAAAGGGGGGEGGGGAGGGAGDGTGSDLPSTGLDDSGTLATLAAAFLLVGGGFITLSRRPTS